MLQINTGKLYARGVGRTNHLRGVLYSNLELRYGYDVETAAGTLRETDGIRGNRAIVYEIEERIEQAEVGPGLLISHAIGPFLTDFAALATFGLRAIVSPDPEVVDRLTSKEPSLASYDPPSKFIRRYFDEQIPLQEGEIAPFKELVDGLLALDRRHFLGAMRAIRTFVTALHRMRDDLALAYTLLVSAVESLAQEFDGYTTSWKDGDERKRVPVDRALKKASKRTGNAVREAILGSEHASLARRYRAFVLHHVDRKYFRAPYLIAGDAIARHELGEALRQAYMLRSRYVHNVRQLPDAITLSDSNREATQVDRRPVLNFQGLVRLTHHVIQTFVKNGPTTTYEPYNYRREEAGVVMVPLAPEMWVGQPLKSAKQARQRLEGHLEQLVPVLMNAPNATVTDLRPIFPDIERLTKSCGKLERTQLLVLYALFANLVPKKDHSAKLDALIEQHMDVIGAPSSEALVTRTVFGLLEAWSIEVHRDTLRQYISARVTPSGLQVPRILEAAMCLALADRFRLARRHQEARDWIAIAVEACPGHQGIRDLEERFSYRKRVDWQKTLMPRLVLRQASKHNRGFSATNDASDKTKP